MEPLSTVFLLNLTAKTKENLDRKKIHSYEDLLKQKNSDVIKSLNIPINEIEEKYKDAEKQFSEIFFKPFAALRAIPKAYKSIISCITMPKDGKIIQVYGQKSSGKSCVMLEIANKFLKDHPHKNVSIINGSSGITKIRLQKLPFQRVNYKDVYTLSSLIAAIEQIPQKSTGMIIIDGLLKLVKTFQKPKQQLKNIVKKIKQYVKQHNIKYILENATNADKIISLQDKPIYNAQSQFSWIISSSCQTRVSVHKLPSMYRVFLLKSQVSCTQNYHNFQISDYGYEQIS